jgi:glyoxylase-like metal-dependent hydrolase (beta-lactamase superfamily II)
MFAVVLALLMVLTACSSAPPAGPAAAKSLIDESAAAMGGWAALDSVKSQEIVTGGTDVEPLQAMEPSGQPPRLINNFGQTITIDYEKSRMRLSFDAIREYPAKNPMKFVEVIDGDAGMLETPQADGKTMQERMHPSRFATRLRDMRRMPMRLLYTAKNSPDITREPDKVDGKITINVLHFKDSGQNVELQLDSYNKLPLRVLYTEDDPIYGDTLNELAFFEWRDYSGIRLPQTQAIFLNGNKIREEHVRTLINNPKYDDSSLTIPAEIRSQAEVGERVVSQWPIRRLVMGVNYLDFGRDQKIEIVEAGKGLYHIKGSDHHTLAIEMKDYVVVVEAPFFEERSVAVIKAIEDKIPNKPIKYLVLTHFHIDHTGGTRAFAAKGATILTDEKNVEFVKTMLARPKTVKPDSFAKAGNVMPNVEGFKDAKTLTDGDRTIELREIANPHADGMIVVYLPKEKMLFESDLFTPGQPVDPTNAQGIENAAALQTAIMSLKVDGIIGGHGNIGPMSELSKIVALGKKSS